MGTQLLILSGPSETRNRTIEFGEVRMWLRRDKRYISQVSLIEYLSCTKLPDKQHECIKQGFSMATLTGITCFHHMPRKDIKVLFAKPQREDYMGNAQDEVEKAWTVVNLRKGETLQA